MNDNNKSRYRTLSTLTLLLAGTASGPVLAESEATPHPDATTLSRSTSIEPVDVLAGGATIFH